MSTTTARSVRRGTPVYVPRVPKPARRQPRAMGGAYATKAWTPARLNGIHRDVSMYVALRQLQRHVAPLSKEDRHAAVQ